MALCRNEAVLKWMSTCDHLMYQALVEILIPDVLRPIPSKERPRTLQLDTFPTLMRVLLHACGSALARSSRFGLRPQLLVSSFLLFSGALTQAIRNFAKSLEGWLSHAMNAIPQPMIQTKVEETSTSGFLRGRVLGSAHKVVFSRRLLLSVPLRKRCADTLL